MEFLFRRVEERIGASTTTKLLLKDPKLKEGTVTVKVIKISDVIINQLVKNNVVNLKNYKAFKNLRCDELENVLYESETDELGNEVNKLMRRALLQTKRYEKKIGIEQGDDDASQRSFPVTMVSDTSTRPTRKITLKRKAGFYYPLDEKKKCKKNHVLL